MSYSWSSPYEDLNKIAAAQQANYNKALSGGSGWGNQLRISFICPLHGNSQHCPHCNKSICFPCSGNVCNGCMYNVNDYKLEPKEIRPEDLTEF